MSRNKNANTGFTLIEMLLVLVIAGMLLYMLMGYMQQRTLASRVDRVTIQMQQALNAGLSYYVVNGAWPPNRQCLQGLGGTNCIGTVRYLPTTFTSPWGAGAYTVTGPGSPPVLLYVYTPITSATANGTAASVANVIAGKLPLSYTSSAAPSGSNPPASGTACTAATTTCYVVTAVNIPGQNLNNAPAVNFAGVYKHGGCVPVPSCPVDAKGNTMTPQIIVVPTSVSGLSDPNSRNVYPISSFTAFVSGAPATNPPACPGGSAVSCQAVNGISGATYWRVCLQVITPKGQVSQTNTGGSSSSSFPFYPWGGNVSLMAVTRCSIANEPSGSPFTVYSQ